MKKQPTNSNCSVDTKDVKDNYRNYRICLYISITIIILGL